MNAYVYICSDAERSYIKACAFACRNPIFFNGNKFFKSLNTEVYIKFRNNKSFV